MQDHAAAVHEGGGLGHTTEQSLHLPFCRLQIGWHVRCEPSQHVTILGGQVTVAQRFVVGGGGALLHEPASHPYGHLSSIILLHVEV